MATTKRHPSRTRHRTAVDARRQARSRWTSTSSSTAARTARCRRSCSRAARIHAAGPYSCPNVRIRGRAVATNAPPHGAFRGFGAPQSIFALERHMDQVARGASGLTPEEFRRRNFITPGQTTRDRPGRCASRSTWTRCSIARWRCPDYHAKRERFARGESRARAIKTRHRASPRSCTAPASPDRARSTWRRSSDVEATAEGTRARAGREHRDRPGHEHDLLADRRRRARHRLRRRRDRAARHGATCPTAGRRSRRAPAWSSASWSRSARARPASTRSLDAGLLREPYTPTSFSAACRELRRRRTAPLRASSQYQPPPGIHWDDEKYQGDAYGAYAWAVYVAEVSRRHARRTRRASTTSSRCRKSAR